jgi:4-pyridoxate dehydrogenase
VRPCLLHPASRGSVRLRSADPRDAPCITQNFLAEPADLAVLRAAVRRARDIVAQPPLDAFRGSELSPGPERQSDADLDRWIRQTITTASHPCCSCAMGSGAEAVLDATLRVRGIEALRVVDASAMPEVPSGNINAAVLMLAEKASDLIRGLPPAAPGI